MSKKEQIVPDDESLEYVERECPPLRTPRSIASRRRTR
jgi:hypothetical protein